jgi:hypothetical protein
VIWTDTSSETSVGTLKLHKAIEKSCSDILATPQKCVKVFRQIIRYLAIKDDHDSWLMGNVYNLYRI